MERLWAGSIKIGVGWVGNGKGGLGFRGGWMDGMPGILVVVAFFFSLFAHDFGCLVAGCDEFFFSFSSLIIVLS